MHSSDPSFPLYPIMAFLGFVVSLIPLPLHLQAWNSGTCAFMLWTSLSCLAKAINSIVWAGNVKDSSPVWCDISSRLFTGANVGIPASTLCISRRLYLIASSTSYPDKRRTLIVDLCIAVGLPILLLIISYVVQTHRYTVIEEIGCYSAILHSLASVFLVHVWPLVIGCVSFIYSALSLRILLKWRSRITRILSSNQSLTVSRYIRLMIVCVVDMCFNVPFGAVRLYGFFHSTSGTNPLEPWISWDHVHANISTVNFSLAASWRSDQGRAVNMELSLWFNVVSAFIFFALFGFGSDVRKFYKDAFQKCLKPLKSISIFEGVWKKQARDSDPPTLRNDAGLSLTSHQRHEVTLVGGKDFVEKQYSVDQDTTLQGNLTSQEP